MQLSCKTDGAIYIIMPKRILHFIRESVRSVSGCAFHQRRNEGVLRLQIPKSSKFLVRRIR